MRPIIGVILGNQLDCGDQVSERFLETDCAILEAVQNGRNKQFHKVVIFLGEIYRHWLLLLPMPPETSTYAVGLTAIDPSQPVGSLLVAP